MAFTPFSAPLGTRSAGSLHRTFIVRAGVLGLAAIGIFAWATRAVVVQTPDVRRAVGLYLGALIVLLVVLMAAIWLFLERKVSRPATELAEAAEAVAAGDFSIRIRHASSDDEIGRLARAIGGMILELRRLAQAIAGSSTETNAMSSEITAGSEEMAATAGEIANTASDLSAQATMMAETIATLAGTAGALRTLAVTLDTGAREGVDRNTMLHALAVENRASLDASASSLDTLVNDVHDSAMAVEVLADESMEITGFVSLVRKLARQSKLLALNAAMEAARAGEQGEGFAVVASEVRRLSAMSSDAAERTESVLKGVISGIENSRESAARAVAMADEVRASTRKASSSFAEIERAVSEAESWTMSVASTSASTGQLVAEMTERLDSLAGGTEAFAAAMEQVAASSQEQSAATQEIAGAANTLVAAGEKLNKLVGSLRLESGETAPAEAVSAAPGLYAVNPPAGTLSAYVQLRT